MNVHVPVTMAAMLVFLTCLTVTAVSGKVLTVERASLETDEVRSTLEEDNATIRLDSLPMKQQMDDLKADTKHDDPAKVAFSVASKKDFGPVNIDTNIPYEVTYTNVGNGWNSAIDAFQAPVKGFYVVTATMRSHGDANAYTICKIVHTDSVGQTTMANMFGGVGDHDGAESGMSNTVIIQLEQGDYVSVRLEGRYEGYLWSTNGIYSTFSGFLLFT